VLSVAAAVHEATGGWDAPLLAVAAALLVMATAGAASVGRRAAVPA